MKEKKRRTYLIHGLIILLAALLLVAASSVSLTVQEPVTQASVQTSIPAYSGKIYTVLNDNVPGFTSAQKKNTEAFETYSNLDSFGRCQVAFANICEELMPTEDRESISSVHPTGWQSNMGWERCHLIGFQLAGENANEKNLITGTHDFNVSGMLPFENMVADYVKETGNHVLYRVTPLFMDNELVARGVEMEAYSVEDEGEGICFHVFVHNVQDGETINYETGIVSAPVTSQKSSATDSSSASSGSDTVYWVPNGEVYHTNRNCSSLSSAKTVLSGTIAESGKDRKCSRCP